MKIISVEDGQIFLQNNKGLKLRVTRDEDGYFGFSGIYLQDVSLGESENPFLHEDNIWEEERDEFADKYLPGRKWSPSFKARKYDIIENSEEEGFIKFYDYYYPLGFSISIRLKSDTYAFEFEYEIKPIAPIKHELYVSFPIPHKDLVFIKYPFETSKRKTFKDIWTVYPKKAFVPFLFGAAEPNGKKIYFGIGYHLSQEDLTDGKIQYNLLQKPEFPLRIYFPYRHFGVYQWEWTTLWGGMRRESYKMKFIFVLAPDQTNCIASYRNACGYDTSLPPISLPDLKESVRKLMNGYKNTNAFVDVPGGKAYRQLIEINPNSSNAFEHGYGLLVPVGANMQLGLQLYRYYRIYPEEAWAKEHAIEIAKFFIESVNKKTNSVPIAWHSKEKKFTAYIPSLTKKGFIYATWAQALGAIALYQFALGLEEEEKKPYSDWKELAVKIMKDISSKVNRSGRLARDYTEDGTEGSLVVPAWPLVALDYFFHHTGDDEFKSARDKLEEWTYENFIKFNNFYGVSGDEGALGSPHPLNHDTFGLSVLVYYFLSRYIKDGNKEHLQISLDLTNYYWLSCVPTQFQNYRNITKGLSIEQDSYMAYDVPWRGPSFLAAFPKLSEVSGDEFYKDFFEMLLKVQLSFQLPLDYPLPSFHIGLAPSPEMYEPLDLFAEPTNSFIVEFPAFFFETLTHEFVKKI